MLGDCFRCYRDTLASLRVIACTKVSRRVAVMAMAPAVAVVGIMSFAAFGNFGSPDDLSPRAEALAVGFATEIDDLADVPASLPFDRFAYVPPGLMAVALAPASPSWSTETATADDPDGWSVETRAERLTPPVSLRLSLPAHPNLPARPAGPRARQKLYTLKQRLAELAPAAQSRLIAKFAAAQASWPPAEITLVAIKDERALELYARPAGGGWKHIHRYRVLAASGGAGPKLRQGDRQVPEGVYGISFLNPNSQYHVSLRVNYPNAFDRQMAAKEGRKELGGDIMIHGKNLSAGCLAVGDEAAEELFVVAALAGLSNVKLVIAPTDFRKKGLPPIDPAHPDWVPKLYAEVASAMADYKSPTPAASSLLSFLFSK